MSSSIQDLMTAKTPKIIELAEVGRVLLLLEVALSLADTLRLSTIRFARVSPCPEAISGRKSAQGRSRSWCRRS